MGILQTVVVHVIGTIIKTDHGDSNECSTRLYVVPFQNSYELS